jgi:hypothetical protein
MFSNVISGVNTKKFVRFDKHGLYGIDGIVDGASWTPENINDIDEKATFALTWEGLKVTSNGAVLKIGDNRKVDPNDNTIFKIIRNNPINNTPETTMEITSDGEVHLKSGISWEESTSPTQVVYASPKEDGAAPIKPVNGTLHSSFPLVGTNGDWHRKQDTAIDIYASYTYDGGNTWGEVV